MNRDINTTLPIAAHRNDSSKLKAATTRMTMQTSIPKIVVLFDSLTVRTS